MHQIRIERIDPKVVFLCFIILGFHPFSEPSKIIAPPTLALAKLILQLSELSGELLQVLLAFLDVAHKVWVSSELQIKEVPTDQIVLDEQRRAIHWTSGHIGHLQ